MVFCRIMRVKVVYILVWCTKYIVPLSVGLVLARMVKLGTGRYSIQTITILLGRATRF